MGRFLISMSLIAACSSGEQTAPSEARSAIDQPQKTPAPLPKPERKAAEDLEDPAKVPEPGFAIGDQATPFSLPDDTGKDVSLAQFRDQRAVLLAFYPKDFTGG